MNLTLPIFTDETKAREHFESLHWPNGPFCPHCGETERVYRLNGESHRPGLIHCNSCHGAFTVTTGTVMESSHLPLTKWALGFYLMSSSKKGISAHQLHRTLGVTYKTAWFMAHRIREAMRPTDDRQLGGEGKTVEADETYVGGKAKNRAYAKTLPQPRSRRVAGRARRQGTLAPCCRRYGKDAETDPGRSYRQGNEPPHRSKPGLYRDRRRLCEP